MTTSLAVILFASSLGRWVDIASSRLRTLLITISVNRIVVILACLCWTVLLTTDHVPKAESDDVIEGRSEVANGDSNHLKVLLFLLVLVLSVCERLSRLANLLSIERDWVPTIAIPNIDDKGQDLVHDLAFINSAMSRVDLACKVLSPVVISSLLSSPNLRRLGPIAIIALNLITWPLEYWTAREVWKSNVRLQQEQFRPPATRSSKPTQSPFTNPIESVGKLLLGVVEWIVTYVDSLRRYFSTDISVPSVAMTSLHFSVLNFSGVLTVFLVDSGFTVKMIMWGEILSAIFEMCSTFIFPVGVKRLSGSRKTTSYMPLEESIDGSKLPPIPEEGPEDEEEGPSEDQSKGASRLGLWALIQMLVVLVCLLLTENICLTLSSLTNMHD